MKRLSQLTHAGEDRMVPPSADPAPFSTHKATSGYGPAETCRASFTHPAFTEKARQDRLTSRDERWAKWGGWVCLLVALAALALNYWATGGQVDYPLSSDCFHGECR